MKKIIYLIAHFIFFISMLSGVKAIEIDTDAEYKYRFYKEIKQGEYINAALESDYEYTDDNDVIYGEYSDWTSDCDYNKGFDYLYEYKYIYSELLTVQYIKILNTSSQNLTFKSIDVYNITTLLNSRVYSCTSCNSNNTIIYPGGNLIIILPMSVYLKNLSFNLEFYEDNIDYDLVLSHYFNFHIKKLVASLSTNTNITNYAYNDDFTLYYNNTITLDELDDSTYPFRKLDSIETSCKKREVKNYRYNILKDYYDDNYYTSIDEIDFDCADTECDSIKSLYKIDYEDYITSYTSSSNKELLSNLNLVKTGNYKEKNYKYLKIFILLLLLSFLICIKYLKNKSIENDN